MYKLNTTFRRARSQTILVGEQYVSATAAKTLLEKQGRSLTLQQIRKRNTARTLHDSSLDRPFHQAQSDAQRYKREQNRTAMAELIASIDAAKLKLGAQI